MFLEQQIVSCSQMIMFVVPYAMKKTLLVKLLFSNKITDDLLVE